MSNSSKRAWIVGIVALVTCGCGSIDSPYAGQSAYPRGSYDACSPDAYEEVKRRLFEGYKRLNAELLKQYEACQRAVAYSCVLYSDQLRRRGVLPIGLFTRQNALERACALGYDPACQEEAPTAAPKLKGPRLLEIPKQPYPADASRLGISGNVLLRVLVDPAGQPTRVVVIDAQPIGFFEESALRWIDAAKFESGPVDKRRSPIWWKVRLHFRP